MTTPKTELQKAKQELKKKSWWTSLLSTKERTLTCVETEFSWVKRIAEGKKPNKDRRYVSNKGFLLPNSYRQAQTVNFLIFFYYYARQKFIEFTIQICFPLHLYITWNVKLMNHSSLLKISVEITYLSKRRKEWKIKLLPFFTPFLLLSGWTKWNTLGLFAPPMSVNLWIYCFQLVQTINGSNHFF